MQRSHEWRLRCKVVARKGWKSFVILLLCLAQKPRLHVQEESTGKKRWKTRNFLRVRV
jgi:hypothetical protein